MEGGRRRKLRCWIYPSFLRCPAWVKQYVVRRISSASFRFPPDPLEPLPSKLPGFVPEVAPLICRQPGLDHLLHDRPEVAESRDRSPGPTVEHGRVAVRAVEPDGMTHCVQRNALPARLDCGPPVGGSERRADTGRCDEPSPHRFNVAGLAGRRLALERRLEPRFSPSL